jgi:hypothetical protein
MARNQSPPLTVTIGEGVATIRREGSSVLLTAGILGRESENGRDRVYLDRMVHRPGESCVGWELHGSYSTILESTSHS